MDKKVSVKGICESHVSERNIAHRFIPVKLNGQLCIHDKAEECLYHWVREPFWSAGKIYRWPGSPAGLGVNRSVLDYAISHACKVRVFTEGKFDRCYEADPSEWLQFVHKYNAIYWANELSIHLLQWCPKYFKTIRNEPVFGIIVAVLQGGS